MDFLIKYKLFITVNIFLTVIFCLMLGPAAWKLDQYFGLVGWAGRTPFYLLHFSIGVLVVSFRPDFSWITKGVLAGVLATLPLAFFAYSAKCPDIVPFLRVVFGMVQGLTVSFILERQVVKLSRTESLTYSH